MTRWLIFCVGEASKKFSSTRATEYGDEIVAFLDNSPTKQGMLIDGTVVLNPTEISKLKYDRIAVPEQHYREILQQLAALGIEPTVMTKIAGWDPQTRKDWLFDYARIVSGRAGSVAEVGVFRGDFAKYINEAFPDAPLYLFDTFEGFPECDVKNELENSSAEAGRYDATSVEYVLSRLPHPENALVRKGYFPDTATGMHDSFQFVNLDLDLYAPTLSGLRLFYPQMVGGGVILVHDYFSATYPGVKKALEEFERECGPLLKLPIGDKISIAILKPIR